MSKRVCRLVHHMEKNGNATRSIHTSRKRGSSSIRDKEEGKHWNKPMCGRTDPKRKGARIKVKIKSWGNPQRTSNCGFNNPTMKRVHANNIKRKIDGSRLDTTTVEKTKRTAVKLWTKQWTVAGKQESIGMMISHPVFSYRKIILFVDRLSNPSQRRWDSEMHDPRR